MRGAREARPRLFAVVVALLLPLATHGTARAEETPVRILIRTIVPLDEALHERTVGQVSDLRAKVERATDATLEPSLTARLAQARSLATRREAAMVVWFEHPPDAGPIVFIALPSRERVLVRPVAARPNDVMARSTSAMLEAASLVVRSALLAFEAGAPLGVPNEELTRDETPAAPQEPAREAPAPAPSPSRPTRPRQARPSVPAEQPVTWRPFVGAGWQVTIDGRSPAGARAGVLEGGVRYGRWAALTRGSLGLPSHTRGELASLDVSRHSASILFGYTFARTSSVELEGLAGTGAVIVRRTAFARDASFSPTPPTTLTTPAGVAEVRVSWTASRSLPVRLGLAAGADVLVQPPSFSYESARGVVRHPAWFVEPRLGFVAVLQP
ncbi:MAG: hypothetical protein BGO98_25620 [Myxococcales bacterium 68-20]|nr:MAG: hypothetical protein BGO98_25620 [Myxococcales bacterium 68-20]